MVGDRSVSQLTISLIPILVIFPAAICIFIVPLPLAASGPAGAPLRALQGGKIGRPAVPQATGAVASSGADAKMHTQTNKHATHTHAHSAGFNMHLGCGCLPVFLHLLCLLLRCCLPLLAAAPSSGRSACKMRQASDSFQLLPNQRTG